MIGGRSGLLWENSSPLFKGLKAAFHPECGAFSRHATSAAQQSSGISEGIASGSVLDQDQSSVGGLLHLEPRCNRTVGC